MYPNVDLEINKEIEKYLVKSFIVPIDYSPCIYIIVPIIKHNGEVRCWTYFRDINKA